MSLLDTLKNTFSKAAEQPVEATDLTETKIGTDIKGDLRPETINAYVEKAKKKAVILASDPQITEQAFKLLDDTSLNDSDTPESITEDCTLLLEIQKINPELSPGGFCTTAKHTEVSTAILKDTAIHRVSVAAGFPTPINDIYERVKNIKKALKNGATEIDVVLKAEEFVEAFGEENLQAFQDELATLKQACDDTPMKVILENSILAKDCDEAQAYERIYAASIIALQAGAEFIKTSTGKVVHGATPEHLAVMVQALKDFEARTGEKRGLKPAGGVSTVTQIMTAMAMFQDFTGDKFPSRERARLGSSSGKKALLRHLETQTGDECYSILFEDDKSDSSGTSNY